MEKEYKDLIMYLGRYLKNSFLYGIVKDGEIVREVIFGKNLFRSKAIGSIYPCTFKGDSISYSKNALRLFDIELSEEVLKKIKELKLKEDLESINKKANQSFSEKVSFSAFTISEIRLSYVKVPPGEKAVLLAKVINYITNL